MIIEELCLTNFGPYLGEHSIQLAPPDANSPIVIIGGLNGSGKTTLLEAIQLALYGKRVQGPRRDGAAYPNYLRRCISRMGPARAAVELAFRHRSDGIDRRYRIAREWRVPGETVVEDVRVFVDGDEDPLMCERWDELVERLLPQGLARLLLFDGEQVQELADPAGSREVLHSALDALLGLDIVEQLGRDLAVLERRTRLGRGEKLDQEQIKSIDAELAALGSRRDEAARQLDVSRGVSRRATRTARRIEGRFQREGGALAANREQIEQAEIAARAQLDESHAALLGLCAEDSPLLLVSPLVERVRARAREEEQAQIAAGVGELLATRDAGLLRATHARFGAEVAEFVRRHLDAENRTGARDAVVGIALGLTPDARSRVEYLARDGLERLMVRTAEAVVTADGHAATLQDIERQIAAAPDEAAIHHLLGRRAEALKAVQEAILEEQTVGAELEALEARIEQRSLERQRLLELQIAEDFRVEDDGRLLAWATKARGVMRRFYASVRKAHVERISAEVLESMRALLRKPSLVTLIEIEPASLDVRLSDESGTELRQNELSAGERQLLAISLVWGLLRASGRTLPIVVDTPLGRLDGPHRALLLERFFPVASRQVILLSTDQEIGSAELELLAPAIGRTYRIVHDDTNNTSSIVSDLRWGS